jgi:hypothetical protein
VLRRSVCRADAAAGDRIGIVERGDGFVQAFAQFGRKPIEWGTIVREFVEQSSRFVHAFG